jgi:hypothetical protein
MLALWTIVVSAFCSAAQAGEAGFSSVGVAADGTVWVGVWNGGHDARGPRYDGGLARLSVGRRGARLRAGPSLEGDRVVALLPAELDGAPGAVAVLAWQVEGPRPARFAFVDGRGAAREIGEAPACHAPTSLAPANGGLRLTCEVDADTPYLEPGRTEVLWEAAGLTVSSGAAVPGVRVVTTDGMEVRLEQPSESEPRVFSVLVAVRTDGSEVRLGAEALPRAFR